jgi:hypothetical protein
MYAFKPVKRTLLARHACSVLRAKGPRAHHENATHVNTEVFKLVAIKESGAPTKSIPAARRPRCLDVCTSIIADCYGGSAAGDIPSLSTCEKVLKPLALVPPRTPASVKEQPLVRSLEMLPNESFHAASLANNACSVLPKRSWAKQHERTHVYREASFRVTRGARAGLAFRAPTQAILPASTSYWNVAEQG